MDTKVIAGMFTLLTGAAIGYGFLGASSIDDQKHSAANASISSKAPNNIVTPLAPLQSPKGVNKVKAQNPKIADLMAQKDPNERYGTFGKRFEEVVARRNGQTIDAQALWNAMQQKEPWQPLQETPTAPELSDADKNDGREFININPMKIESLVAGDKLDITLSQTNKNYIVNIDNVQAESGNNVTWTGHIDGLEADNQVNITRGDTLIVAGITTPEGLFELQARGNQGWIASSSTMFKGEDVVIEVTPDANMTH